MQLREMRDYCDRRKWDTEVFSDHGFSGAKESRPRLDELMKECRRGKWDVVLVYRFDRFARSLKQLILALEEFQNIGVQFVSLHEQVDTTTPAGRMLFQIIGAMAEFERELTRGRVISGIANARAKGVKLGRRRADANTEKITQRRAQGASWEEIGRELGISRMTAQRALLREANAQKPCFEANSPMTQIQ
jgi:DNA invertase Pin-like site-specific DNA recombinase